MNVKSLYKTGENVCRSFQRSVFRSKQLKTSYVNDEASVSEFHQKIIQQCFDSGDAGTIEELMADVVAGDCAIIVVREGKRILGGVVVEHYWSTSKKIMLIAWLAVDENQRGRNIGTLLVEEARSYARANGALILLGQVKNPDLFEEVIPAYGDPLKRAKFYSRFDCKRMEVPCYVPAFYDHQEPIYGVMLTLFPLSAEQALMTEIYVPELALFVDELVGQDMGKESRTFVEACEDTVALTPFRELY